MGQPKLSSAQLRALAILAEAAPAAVSTSNQTYRAEPVERSLIHSGTGSVLVDRGLADWQQTERESYWGQFNRLRISDAGKAELAVAEGVFV